MLSKCHECKFFHPDLCAVNPSYWTMEEKLRSRFSEVELEGFDVGTLPCSDWEQSEELQPMMVEVTLTRQNWKQLLNNSPNLPLELGTQIRSALGEPDEIQMLPVESSNIAAIGYDPHDLVLQVDFLNGGHYQYFDVPPQIFEGFQAASSKGGYFNYEIKGEFDYERLE